MANLKAITAFDEADWKWFALNYRTSIAAATASMFSTMIGFPLGNAWLSCDDISDSVKTRMQAYKYSSIWECFRYTHKTEGLRGFFRGVMIPLWSVTVVRTTSFTIFESSRAVYAKKFTDLDHYPTTRDTYRLLGFWTNASISFAAGLTSGACISCVATPLEFAKLSTQIELLLARTRNASSPDSNPVDLPKARGSIYAARQIYNARGFRGLYSGYPYHLARDALGTGFYFGSYESMKRIMTPANGQPGALTFAISGASCGALAWCLVFPIDTAKSITQRDILMHRPGETFKRRSFLSFKWLSGRMYRGMTISILRSALVNGVNFSIYEYMRKEIRAWAD